MKLSFVIAGMQKAGTTALWHFLRQHPELFLSEKKELHFFDDETLNWHDPDYDLMYHKHFSGADISQQCGEATPIYTYWPPALNRLRAYHANIKIIVLLRCPIDRAYSHWAMETGRGAETLSFSDAIRSGRKRLTQSGELPGIHRVFSYVERGFYSEQLNRLYSLFPKRNILLVQQDVMQSHHELILDRICDFLRVNRFQKYPVQDAVFHKGTTKNILPPIAKPDRHYLEDLYIDDLHCLATKYGISFSWD